MRHGSLIDIIKAARLYSEFLSFTLRPWVSVLLHTAWRVVGAITEKMQPRRFKLAGTRAGQVMEIRKKGRRKTVSRDDIFHSLDSAFPSVH